MMGSVSLSAPPAPLNTVCCHGCGARARELRGPNGRGPRWACTDPRCDFRRGWRLEAAARWPSLPQIDGPNTIYAVPLIENGHLWHEHAVLWPGRRR